MGEVVTLDPARRPAGSGPAPPGGPVNTDLCLHLEYLLEWARKGEFQGILYTTIITQDVGVYEACGTGWMGRLGGIHIAVGAVEILKHKLINSDNFVA